MNRLLRDQCKMEKWLKQARYEQALSTTLTLRQILTQSCLPKFTEPSPKKTGCEYLMSNLDERL
jgi:hypothetical protein